MWAVSDRYLATLARSHTQRCYVDILHDGQVVATLTDGVIIDLGSGEPANLIGGSINVDASAIIRRVGSINFLDVSGQLTPTDVDALFAPFITEIRVWIGVRYWDAPLPAINDPFASPSVSGTGFAVQADTEYVPVGTLVVTDIEGDYPQLSLTTYDRAWLLGTFAAPYTITKNTGIVAAIIQLLTVNTPAGHLAYNLPTDVELTVGSDQLYDVDTGVGDAVTSLATLAGIQLYVDPMGTWVGPPEPATDDPPVITYAPGQYSMMMRPRRIVSGSQAYNAVVFTGESASAAAPVRGYAQDDDPTSLTYVPRVGARIYTASSPVITTTAAANAAAATTLRRILGIPDQITMRIMPNHAHEGGDVIHLTEPTLGIDFPVIADKFAVNLRAADGEMAITCRNRVIH